MVTKRARNFHRFLQTVESFTEGQVRVTDWDCDRFAEVSLDVRPNGGYYKGGRFKFSIRMPGDFPACAPNVWCNNDVYHPNIDSTMYDDPDCSNICVSTLDEWQTGMGMEDIVQAILFLFHNPNPEDPLSPYISGFGGSDEDWEEFGNDVLTAMKGGEVEDHKFENCWIGDDDKGETEEKAAVADGASCVPEDGGNVNEVEVIMKKVDEIILTRTEAGKGESEDEGEDEREDDTDDEDEDAPEVEVDGLNIEEAEHDNDTSNLTDEPVQEQSVVDTNTENTVATNTPQVLMPNESVAEGASAPLILSRQNSKLEKDLNVTSQELDHGHNETSLRVDRSDNVKVYCDTNLGDFMDMCKSCSFIAPDFDLALYTLSAVCVYSMIRTFNHVP